MKMQKTVMFVKTSLKINILKKKRFARLETIDIMYVNIEMLPIEYAIENKCYLKKLLQFFIMIQL